MPASSIADQHGVRWELIEDFGVRIGGAMGWPPMAGRTAGLLLLSEEPVSMTQLQESLEASKGSISEVTRLLVDNGVVERFKERGERQYMYRWRDDAWIGCLRHQVQATTQLLDFSRDARRRAAESSQVQRRRLDDMVEYYVFIVERLEQLLSEYLERSGEEPEMVQR